MSSAFATTVALVLLGVGLVAALAPDEFDDSAAPGWRPPGRTASAAP